MLARAGGSTDLASATVFDVLLVSTQLSLLQPAEAHEIGLLSIAASLEGLAAPKVPDVVMFAAGAVTTFAVVGLRAVNLLPVTFEGPGAFNAGRTKVTEMVV